MLASPEDLRHTAKWPGKGRASRSKLMDTIQGIEIHLVVVVVVVVAVVTIITVLKPDTIWMSITKYHIIQESY